MRRSTFLSLPLLLCPCLAPAGVVGQAQEEQAALEARVWLDRGEEPVLQRGDRVRVYYRTSEDAHAAIFRIDTDGEISMVFPQHPLAIAPVLAGRDYRLMLPQSPTWAVEDDPGVGYFFIVASLEPLDFSSFAYDERTGWDLGAVGGVVYEDPYVAIDDYVAELVPDWEVAPYALDFLTYHVGNTYSYPRFLCYDCHTRRAYSAWNPYSAVCTSFRVVIWDDPYFYPSYRYSGTRVVVPRLARALPRYELVVRAPGDIGVRPLVRPRDAPTRRVAQFKEAPALAPSSRVPVRRRTPPRSAQQMPQGQPSTGRAGGGQQGASGRPALQRRPSASLPGRAPTSETAPRSPPGRASRAAPGPPGRGPQPQAGPPRQTRPVSGRATPTRPAAERPSAPARARAAPRAAPASPSRPTAPARGRPSARPSSPPSRPSTGRSGPPASRPSSRPSKPPASRPSVRPAPAPREPAPRPTVRPRGRGRGH